MVVSWRVRRGFSLLLGGVRRPAINGDAAREWVYGTLMLRGFQLFRRRFNDGARIGQTGTERIENVVKVRRAAKHGLAVAACERERVREGKRVMPRPAVAVLKPESELVPVDRRERLRGCAAEQHGAGPGPCILRRLVHEMFNRGIGNDPFHAAAALVGPVQPLTGIQAAVNAIEVREFG
jgi:hypothetical protein